MQPESAIYPDLPELTAERRRHRVIGIGALVFVAVAFVYVLWALRDTYRDWNDFRWVYVSGLTWLHGASPYDFPAWAEQWQSTPHKFFAEPPSQPFIYPPHWALFAIPLAILPYGIAVRLWDAIDIVAFVGLLAIAWSLLRPKLDSRQKRTIAWVLIGLATINGSVRYSLWESQMAVVPTLGVAGAFWAWSQRRTGLLAVFAYVAALKPQIGILPLAFLLMNGAHRGILIAAAVATMVALLSLIPSGITNAPAQLIDCYSRHMHAGFNDKASFSHLPSLWANTPYGHSLFWVGPACAIGWVVGLTWWRRRAGATDVLANDPLVCLALVVSAVPAFLPLHGYDLVVYTPLILSAAALGPSWPAVAIVALVEIVGRAQVVIDKTGIYPLMPYFTVALLVFCTSAFARASRTAKSLDSARQIA